MRYNEFNILKESPEEEIEQLQKEIAARVTKVADVALLNKVSSLLRKTSIGNVARMAFHRDEDAHKFVGRLSEMIVDMDVPVAEKARFLREFGQSQRNPNFYIKASTLFNGTGEVVMMDDWWNGSGMATALFKKMINDPYLTGKHAGEAGPGEVAIAIFHPEITVGTDAANGYDLKYKSEEIEVKTKASEKSSGGGGRWDAAVDHPLTTVLSQDTCPLDILLVPKSVGLTSGATAKTPGIYNILNDPQYLKDPDKPLTENEQREIFKEVLKIAYPDATSDTIASIGAQYPNHTTRSVAQAAFENYRAKQQFTSMLILKVLGDGIQSIHFKNPAQVADKIIFNTMYVRGQLRGMSTQVTIR